MMARRSTIDDLPKELRDTINDLLAAGVTLERIREHLKELGADHISRSSLGRYKQRRDKAEEKRRRFALLAESYRGSVKDQTEGHVIQGAVEMVGGLILEVGDQADEDGAISMKPPEIRDIARALESIAKAKRITLDSTAEAQKQQEEAKTEASAGESGGRIEIVFVDPPKRNKGVSGGDAGGEKAAASHAGKKGE